MTHDRGEVLQVKITFCAMWTFLSFFNFLMVPPCWAGVWVLLAVPLGQEKMEMMKKQLWMFLGIPRNIKYLKEFRTDPLTNQIFIATWFARSSTLNKHCSLLTLCNQGSFMRLLLVNGLYSVTAFCQGFINVWFIPVGIESRGGLDIVSPSPISGVWQVR